MRSFLLLSSFCLATSLIAPPERRLSGPPRLSVRSSGSNAERIRILRNCVASANHGEAWVLANVELAERLTLTDSTASEFLACLQNIESSNNQLGGLVKARVDRIVSGLVDRSLFEPYPVTPRTRRAVTSRIRGGGQVHRREDSPER